MNYPWEVAAVLLASVVLANLPFVNERLLVVGPVMQPAKHWAWRLLELLLGAGLCVALGVWQEARVGQVHGQGWAFYAAWTCLFLTFAFPGFVWRHLRRRRA